MKTMLQKLQSLGQKAAEIQKIVNTAPGKVAQMRETIQLTAGQLQLARSELQQVATGLHVENDEDFTNAFREIAENHRVFREAGYDVTGIDMEVSHGQRLIVHLQHIATMPEQTLRYLLTQHSNQVTLSSILSSIVKAEGLVAKVTTPGLEYTGLIVHLGPAPAVRISWREMNPAEASASVITAAATGPAPTASPAAAATTATTSFAQGSFFATAQPRATAPSTNASAASLEPAAAPTSLSSSRSSFATAKSLQGDWKKEAMERLKNSPGASKYQRH